MKRLLSAVIALFFLSITYAQKGYLPDDNFEQALIDLGYDSAPLDDSVEIAIAEGVTSLDLSNKEITDLTGIQFFVNLTELNCSVNFLTAVNLEENTLLERLDCSLNAMTAIDVSENTSLEYLNLSYNDIFTLDLTLLEGLKELHCIGTSLDEINLTENTQLTHLVLTGTFLEEGLEVGNNTLLQHLECHACILNELDLSNNDALEFLDCSSNFLSELDLHENTALINLNCTSNNLTTLSLVDLPLLEEIRLGFNLLTTLDMRNGTNTEIETFNAVNNPNLECIAVDDEVWSAANWAAIDAICSFDESCGLGFDDEANFSFSLYPNPVNSICRVNVSQLAFYELINTNGKIAKEGQFIAGENELSIEQLPAGIYILALHNEKETVNYKLVKQ